jgi:Niemann-Pick C1 protein
MSNSIF